MSLMHADFSSRFGFAGFIVAVLGTGWVIGFFNTPDEWYVALEKPWFNPPGWVFGPVWTVLYILIAVAGWRTWQREGWGGGMQLWLGQMALNFVWSPVFFGLQRPDAALVIVLGMLMCIAGFIRHSWRYDRVSAGLFVPYAAWVAFAGVLNGMIVLLNAPF